MDYFTILDLKREPFSNSPDPDFFYQSAQHTGCLQQLELAIRLRRGLNVVIGQVGTGKTTLCRELIRRFENETQLTPYLMLDPGMASESAFLSEVVALLTGQRPPEDGRDDRKKEAIKQFLFATGIEKKHTPVLIIDEGQKIAPACLEILREFLNYETNTHKLLQIVIFAQKEFDQVIAAHPNFSDRINLRIDLNPLGFRDTMAMIRYRIQASGGGTADRLFSLPALIAVYLATHGYPRQIIHLCHRILLTLIIQDRTRAGWRLVRSSARRASGHRAPRRWQWAGAGGALALITALVLTVGGWLQLFPITTGMGPAPNKPVAETAREAAPQAARTEKTRPANRPEPGTAIAALSPTKAFGSAMPMAASAAPSADAPVLDSPAKATPMPARLGRVTINPNDTLGGLITTIYGRFAPSHLQAIADANPHILDPDALNVGDIIHFPALPAEVRPFPVHVWWLELATRQRLDEALHTYKGLKQNRLATRLIPYWNPERGLVFSLVMAECFYGRQVAENALAQLALRDAPHARIITFGQDETVFFSDPFQAVAPLAAAHPDRR